MIIDFLKSIFWCPQVLHNEFQSALWIVSWYNSHTWWVVIWYALISDINYDGISYTRTTDLKATYCCNENATIHKQQYNGRLRNVRPMTHAPETDAINHFFRCRFLVCMLCKCGSGFVWYQIKAPIRTLFCFKLENGIHMTEMMTYD